MADTASEKILLQFPQPYTNHNGCDLRFGPDGYLYASFGDGGSGGDPQQYSQNTNSYLGKVLRIDPFSGTAFAIPPTNPFFGQSTKKQEIWAYGLRNPWRCSFDRLTGDYWIGDVGQGIFEEIDFQPANSVGGENYGWRCYESNATYNLAGCSTNTTSFVFPIFEYNHTTPNGCSVTGGNVYRGAQHKNLFGKYIFGDFCSGRIWSTEKIASTFSTSIVGNYVTYQFSSFGENTEGELFISGLGNGKIYQIKDTSDCKPVAFLGLKDSLFVCGSSLLVSTNSGSGLNYSWSLNGNSLPTATLAGITATTNGKYLVTVTNSLLCSAIDSVIVSLNNATPVSIMNLQANYCIQQAADTLVTSVPGGTFSINGTNTQAVFDPSVLGLGTYTVTYTFQNSMNCTSYDSKVTNVEICNNLGKGRNENTYIKILPNPGNGNFNLKTHSTINQEIKLELFDLLGSKVYSISYHLQKGKEEIILDLNHLNSGTYFSVINGVDFKLSEKIILIK